MSTLSILMPSSLSNFLSLSTSSRGPVREARLSQPMSNRAAPFRVWTYSPSTAPPTSSCSSSFSLGSPSRDTRTPSWHVFSTLALTCCRYRSLSSTIALGARTRAISALPMSSRTPSVDFLATVPFTMEPTCSSSGNGNLGRPATDTQNTSPCTLSTVAVTGWLRPRAYASSLGAMTNAGFSQPTSTKTPLSVLEPTAPSSVSPTLSSWSDLGLGTPATDTLMVLPSTPSTVAATIWSCLRASNIWLRFAASTIPFCSKPMSTKTPALDRKATLPSVVMPTCSASHGLSVGRSAADTQTSPLRGSTACTVVATLWLRLRRNASCRVALILAFFS
mmetsp:Transcript_25611/g.73065  ORF Transcript_25611/g.73065 Transcript_25611/m.73065 type:complete len:334 (-) Transcript_25611:161-1162(-)